jgi:tetratricopeptide (TPR) repeat protein
MKKASIILIAIIVFGCAGQNINVNNKAEPLTGQTHENNLKEKSLENKTKNLSFKNIDDAYISMHKDLEELSDYSVRSAFELAVDVLKKEPTHVRANIVLFNAHLFKGNEDQVLEQFQKLISLNPKKSKSCIELGTLFAQLGKISEAIVLFQRSIELDPNCVEGYYNLGRAYSLKRQFDQSINAYKQNIKIDPEHYRAWNNLGWIYMLKKEYKKATEHFNKALEIKPDYSVSLINLGTISLLQKDYDLSEKQFKQYIELRPDDPDGYRNLASVYQKKNQLDDAINTFRELLKIKPDDYVGMNNLAVLLLSKARYGESVKLFREVYNAKQINIKFKNEVKNSLAVASFHLAETLATHADKKQQAVKAYEDYLTYSDNLPDKSIQQVKDKISALQ